MQRVTLSIPAAGYASGDSFAVYGNADAVGCVLSTIDYDRPLTGAAPVIFFPMGTAVNNAAIRKVQTQQLYFGWYQFAVQTRDLVGNVTAAERKFRVFINSGPRPVINPKHSSTVDGRPVFSFVPPAQLRASV